MTFKIAGFPPLLLPVSAGAQHPVRGQLVQPSHDARFVELELRSWISALRSAAACSRHRLCRVLAETELVGVPAAAMLGGRAIGKCSVV